MRTRRGRAEGSIFQREADGRWVATVSLGYDGRGKRKRRTIYGKTKADVAEKLRRLQADHDAGRLVETDALTTGEYLQRWLDNTAKNRVQGPTWARYRTLVEQRLRPLLGGVKLSKLGPLHVEQCYAAMERDGASAHTRKLGGVILSAALKHAVRLKLIPHNPAADVARARLPHKEMLILSETQARALLEAARPHRLYALFALALGAGLRQGELLGLRWADVALDRGVLAVERTLAVVDKQFVLKEPKSKHSRRTVVLPKFALDALRDHQAEALKAGHIAAPVFHTRVGSPIAKSNLGRQVHHPLVKRTNALIAARAAAAGLVPELIAAGVRFHDLRHTHASHLIAAGHSIKAVSRRLGHSGIEITLKVYAHLMPNDDDKVAAGAQALFG